MAAVSSCREVSCQVRQRARPVFILATGAVMRTEHSMKTAVETRRKVRATVGLYAPNLLGYTRATMIGTMGCNSERKSKSQKLHLSLD